MDRTRAAEIIAAYGGDPARWPAGERAAALQLTLDDRALGRARIEAGALDGMMAEWARRDVVGGNAGVATARALAAPVQRPMRSVLRWAVGSGIAAALAVGVVLSNPAAAPQRLAKSATTVSDEQAYAMVFTPTDEDGAI